MFRTLALTAGLLTACPAIADVIHVPGDFTTIQAAIDAAQPGDEIVVASGTYGETIDLQGKPLILRSSSGATFTAIDARGAGSVIRGAGDGAFIEGFTITGGSAVEGGGMFNQGGDPIVRHCIFSGNTAAFGGGVYNREGADPLIADCLFTGNVATTGAGGALHNFQSSPTVRRCTFINNRAHERNGGAAFSFDSDPTFVSCVFSSNSALLNGGALYFDGGMPSIFSCIFLGNTGDFGGAVYCINSDPLLANCAFATNTANVGAGFFSTGSISLIVNCAFAENEAASTGGGLRLVNSITEITNCIAWGNEPDQITDFQATTTVSFSDVEGGWDGAGSNNIDADPMFLQPEAGDLRLMPLSPCVDAGDTSALPPDEADLDGDGDRREPLPRDLADNARVSGDAVDMGPYELPQAQCEADFDGSGEVSFGDLLLLLMDWGACEAGECPFDLDGDGSVGVYELLVILSSWGPCD